MALVTREELIGRIRKRLASRRAPAIGTCTLCGHQQQMMPSYQPLASSMADAQWTCTQCAGQISVTMTIGGNAPTADEDLATLLELVGVDDAETVR